MNNLKVHTTDEFRPTDQLKFRDDLYPRWNHDPGVVEEYAANLEMLPPIKINQHNEIIDGYHRWLAYQTQGVEQIAVKVIETDSDSELLRLAIQANSNHGLQLTDSDKREAAIRLYSAGSGFQIAEDLSLSEGAFRSYSPEIAEQLQAIFDLFMDCFRPQEIADRLGISQQRVESIVKSLTNVSDFGESLDFDRDRDFTVSAPVYDIWDAGDSMELIVENLLYLYTPPFGIVLNPFAGDGSTIDVCRKRLRRCYASDLRPIPARSNQIRQLNVVKSLPDLGERWSEVSLTYLDPPCWSAALHPAYSIRFGAEELAGMPLEVYTASLAAVIQNIAQKQSKGVIAILVLPSEVDHSYQLMSAVGLEIERRIIYPPEDLEWTLTQIDAAMGGRGLLNIKRELLIWRV